MPLDKYHFILKNLISRIEVFKSGLVDGPVQVSSFNRVIGSSWSISILKKLQNNVVLEKKQKSTGCNRIFDLFLPGQPGRSSHDFSYFFFNPTRFQPRTGLGFKTI
jgi:hypothetical protein